MLYPFFIMVVVVGVVAVMMVAVVPKLLEIFDDKSVLPASTRILISISDAFRDYWLIMILIVVVSYFLVSLWKKTPNGKYLYD